MLQKMRDRSGVCQLYFLQRCAKVDAVLGHRERDSAEQYCRYHLDEERFSISFISATEGTVQKPVQRSKRADLPSISSRTLQSNSAAFGAKEDGKSVSVPFEAMSQLTVLQYASPGMSEQCSTPPRVCVSADVPANLFHRCSDFSVLDSPETVRHE